MKGITAALAIAVSITAQQVNPPSVAGITIYVGPEHRDGFVDMDAGVRDSIRDLVQECQNAGFTIARSQDDAQLALIVLGRGLLTNGEVGVGIVANGTGSSVTAPNTVTSLTTRLKVDRYERIFSKEAGTWKTLAKLLVEDLRVWVDANRGALATRR